MAIDNTIVCMLNVGLNVREDFTFVGDHAVAILQDLGFRILQDEVHTSDTEKTLVVRGVADRNLYQVARLCHRLRQDCIAVWSIEDQEGLLVGPKAEAWGPFDPAKFIVLGGGRLSDVLGED